MKARMGKPCRTGSRRGGREIRSRAEAYDVGRMQAAETPPSTDRPRSGEFGFQRVWGRLGVSAGGIKLCGMRVLIDSMHSMGRWCGASCAA